MSNSAAPRLQTILRAAGPGQAGIGRPDDSPGGLRDAVKSGRHGENFICPIGGKSSRPKNSRAVVGDCTRPKNLQGTDPTASSCENQGCCAHGMPGETQPTFQK